MIHELLNVCSGFEFEMVFFDDERHLRAHWVSFSALRFSGVALDGYAHIGYGLFAFLQQD